VSERLLTACAQRLPPQVTRPFLAVSGYLGLPPTVTFSSLSRWNFRLEAADEDRTRPDNLRSLLSFTGTSDEEWFYMIATAIEANGGPLISTMLRCVQAADDNDKNAVLCCLQALTSGIRKTGNLLQRMHERCDPQVFYHNIRPFAAGTKGMAAAGLTQGVFYDEGNGHGHWRQYHGGSNGQSSLIQLFDIFLSVDHHATGDGQTTQREPAGSKGYLKVSLVLPIQQLAG
jgi:indoleamine 2,3-dioxygenase